MRLLDKLYYDLQTYEPEPIEIETTTMPDKNKSMFSSLKSIFKSPKTTHHLTERPKSLYIYGSAGCGKVFIIIFVYDNHTYIHTNRVF